MKIMLGGKLIYPSRKKATMYSHLRFLRVIKFRCEDMVAFEWNV